MTWYRLHFANGKSVAANGEAERDRLVARQTPRVILVEEALIHCCKTCSASGPWDSRWMAFPIHIRGPIPASGQEYEVYCSQACWIAETGGFDLPPWIRTSEEPRPRDLDIALWEAQRAERRRKQEMTERRKVPMPEWKGRGFCKWCNGAMGPADGRAIMWHRGCAEQYKLHAFSEDQWRFLVKRDGEGCSVEGCGNRGHEIEHTVPLWSIWDLPDDDRRSYYGPDNLTLMCRDHHREKTAREAAERAAKRRE